MKIRTGFVSNSSSSSFVVKGFVIPKKDINFNEFMNKILIKYPQIETDYMRELKKDECFDEWEYNYELFSNMRKLGIYATDNYEDGAPYDSILIGELLQDSEDGLDDMIIDCIITGKLEEIKQIIEEISNEPLECKVIVGTRCC